MDMTLDQQSRPIPFGPVIGSNGNGSTKRTVPQLRVGLLGGFRVERVGVAHGPARGIAGGPCPGNRSFVPRA